MTTHSKKYRRIIILLFVTLVFVLLLNTRCGAPRKVWSVKMESVYSREILELKLRAQVYDGTPGDGLIMFKPMMPTTLEDLKIIAEDDKRVQVESSPDGLLITKENTPTQSDYYYLTDYTDRNLGKLFVLANLSYGYYLFDSNPDEHTSVILLLPIHIFITDKSEENYLSNFYQRIVENMEYPIYPEYGIDYLYQFYQKSGYVEVSKVGNTIHLSQMIGNDGTKKIISDNVVELSITEQNGEKYVRVRTLS